MSHPSQAPVTFIEIIESFLRSYNNISHPFNYTGLFILARAVVPLSILNTYERLECTYLVSPSREASRDCGSCDVVMCAKGPKNFSALTTSDALTLKQNMSLHNWFLSTVMRPQRLIKFSGLP